MDSRRHHRLQVVFPPRNMMIQTIQELIPRMYEVEIRDELILTVCSCGKIPDCL